MNTRGLTELVILNVGRASGVLSTRMFTILALMAIITTLITGPTMGRLYADLAIRSANRRIGSGTPRRRLLRRRQLQPTGSKELVASRIKPPPPQVVTASWEVRSVLASAPPRTLEHPPER